MKKKYMLQKSHRAIHVTVKNYVIVKTLFLAKSVPLNSFIESNLNIKQFNAYVVTPIYVLLVEDTDFYSINLLIITNSFNA